MLGYKPYNLNPYNKGSFSAREATRLGYVSYVKPS